jgi:hypothetical protein
MVAASLNPGSWKSHLHVQFDIDKLEKPHPTCCRDAMKIDKTRQPTLTKLGRVAGASQS